MDGRCIQYKSNSSPSVSNPLATRHIFLQSTFSPSHQSCMKPINASKTYRGEAKPFLISPTPFFPDNSRSTQPCHLFLHHPISQVQSIPTRALQHQKHNRHRPNGRRMRKAASSCTLPLFPPRGDVSPNRTSSSDDDKHLCLAVFKPFSPPRKPPSPLPPTTDFSTPLVFSLKQ